MTLLELLLAVTGMAIISAAATFFLSTTLDIEIQGSSRSELYREGLSAMEKMKERVKRTTYLLIPNAHNTTRDILAVSDMINDDNDYYFGDPLFPRIDEDLGGRYTTAGNGIFLIDDDGDGDDEDGSNDEELLDGIDNDGDGNIDEDLGQDIQNDTFPGIMGIDDDADGQVDEMSGGGDKNDEDEDGLKGEESLVPIVYMYDPAIDTLWEIATDQNSGTSPPAVWTALSTHVTLFQVTWEAPQRILIELTLTGDDDSTIQFSEYVYIENTFQKLGKRVR
jgi:hypothetical protein